jgi:L-lactate dehydrogenase (cytochrome)
MDMMQKYPRISDMVEPAERRLPKFVHAYLAAGTGIGQAMHKNEQALSEIELMPRFLRGRVAPDTSCSIFGQAYAAPFGIAPVGLQSLIWPNGERLLAKAAADHKIPYTLSTVAGADLETIGPIAGDMGWFQLYTPSDKAVMRDLLARAKAAGFKTLLVTVDVPGPSRREEMRLAGAPIGSRNPMALTPRVFWQCMTHPVWSLAALANGGKFSFKNLVRYSKPGDGDDITTFIGRQLNGSLTWEYLDEIRKEWDGPLIVKGILHTDDARQAVKAGADGLVISNHGGRQLDAAPPSITILPQIRDLLGNEAKLLFDSGVRSGLDVARALASGADFVLLGRAFMFGLACLGAQGGNHVADILKDELENTMVQLGVTTLDELKATRKYG